MSATDILLTGFGSVSAFGVRRGALDSGPPPPTTIARWPTRGPRRAHLVPAFNAREIVPGLKTRKLDQLTIWSITAAHLALEDAGCNVEDRDPARVAVVCGTGFGCLERSEAFFSSAGSYGYGAADAIVFPETLANSPASHIARFFGFRGPNVTLSCRGISAESALIHARSLLVSGEADLAVVVAGDYLTRPLYEWYEAARVLSRACFDEESRIPAPFREDSGGFLPGEGMAAAILEPAPPGADARAGAYARVTGGCAAVEPGVSFGSWGQRGAPTVALVRKLLGDAGDVRLVVSGANGSAALDRLEAEVIRTCFRETGETIVSAAKAVTGEFEASGLLRLALALSGQGPFWSAGAFSGADAPGAPSEAPTLDRGTGLMFGTAAGGGRSVVSFEILDRSARPAAAAE